MPITVHASRRSTAQFSKSNHSLTCFSPPFFFGSLNSYIREASTELHLVPLQHIIKLRVHQRSFHGASPGSLATSILRKPRGLLSNSGTSPLYCQILSRIQTSSCMYVYTVTRYFWTTSLKSSSYKSVKCYVQKINV
ncbi:hypothetical protein OIU77_003129 [Salix suchowensis]|uniref:Uncharacterized protein n=1 Tax=Salix suchowensis TaxID=1278906 RepID=A0ABQ9AZU5_9ROSI|nr:hypothetical protein OIU77_003129 [Salix suchowensis]